MYKTEQEVYVDILSSGLFGVKTAGIIWEQTMEKSKMGVKL